MNDVLVSIRVLPHVKKYLEKMYQPVYKANQSDNFGQQLSILLDTPEPAESEPVRLTMQSLFEEQISVLLNKNHSYKKYEQFISKYTERWRFVLPKARHRKFSDFTAVRFNSIVDAEIKLKLYTHVDVLTQISGWRKEAAVLNFIESLGMSESDINFNSLLKAYQRYELKKLGVKKKKDLRVLDNAA